MTNMTLGEMIAALKRKDDDCKVSFDFVHMVPNGAHSYRGSYDQLAIGYKPGSPIPVKELLSWLKGAVGREFVGWKGGNYRMDEHTGVWVANPRETGRTAIVAIKDGGYGHLTLITAKTD